MTDENKNNQLKIVSTKDETIDNRDYVKVKIMGNHLELCHIKSVPTRFPVKRLDDNTYLVLGTNEVKSYNKTDTRDENIKSLKRTFKNLRELINTNFYGLPNEKFITLTYGYLQRDNKQVYTDFKVWIKAIRKRYGKCDYINVVEPQATGSWHCHVLVKFYELPNNYIDYNEFRALWKHGSFVNVRDLKECDNIGLYLSAYLSDIELNEDTFKEAQENMNRVEIQVKEVTDPNGNKIKKSFIKGGRMSYYPNKMNLYRSSRGIKKPFVSNGLKGKMILDDYDLQRSNKIELMKDDKVVNVIHYESYTKKGNKKDLQQTAILNVSQNQN